MDKQLRVETIAEMRRLQEGIGGGRWKPGSEELANARHSLEMLMYTHLGELLERAQRVEAAVGMERVLGQMVSYGEGDSPSDEFWSELVVEARRALVRYSGVEETTVGGTEEIKL